MVGGWRFRRPEYTGDQRCMPCTIVNMALTAAFAGAVAAVAASSGADPLTTGVLGLAIVALGTVTIALRGYLVPGTPWLTRRYLPDRVLAWFDKADDAAPIPDDVDTEALLTDGGVVEECVDVDDLCLTESFERDWYAAMAERQDIDGSSDDLSSLLGVDADRLEVEAFGGAFIARYDGRRVGQWESDGAVIADMAAASVLNDRLDRWDEFDLALRSSLLHGLRAFLEFCPVCDDRLVMDEREVSSCCRSIDVVAVTCTGCERRIFEAEHPD